jgi:hypothetical protein
VLARRGRSRRVDPGLSRGYGARMHLASKFTELSAALLAATLIVACAPKNDGVETGGVSESSGDSSGGSSGTVSTQECTPGDVTDSLGGCDTCVCSDQGMWLCNRCSPTTSEATSDATSDATTSGPGTTGATTSGETTSGETTSGTTADTDDTGDTTGGGTFLPACAGLAPSDPLDLVSAQIVGDELQVEVGYGGGCETHEFVLCLDSLDPNGEFANLAIDHDAHGDACEAFIMETLKFDLTPVQQAGPSPFEFFLLGLAGDALSYEF